MAKFRDGDITIAQVIENLKVLATFRTQEVASSNLTIREGLFKKTSGKLNLFKGIVRDEEDSLTNPRVLAEIRINLEVFNNICTKDINNDDNFDIICNARYGFLNLGSKYCDRDTAGGIANLMSTVCKDAERLFTKRLLDRNKVERRKFNQGIYSDANKIHTSGSCWAMVMDWARRFVLNGKLGFGAKEGWTEKKLLHRGKYIANVFNLKQNKNYDSVGEALIGLNPKKKTTDAALLKEIERRDLLLQRYDSERSPKLVQRTVVDKFNDLKYSDNVGDLGLCEIHIGNQNDKGKNTRIECINNLTNKINSWVAEANAARPGRIAHGINFWFDEKISYQRWRVNTQRQLDSKTGVADKNTIGLHSYLGTKIVAQDGGHALGFAYDPNAESNGFCFMDPNFGEWVSPDPRKIASIIYDVLKIYTVDLEKGFKKDECKSFCARIKKTQISLFAKKK